MLPLQYQWLLNEPSPKMLIEGLKLYGTLETKGKDSTQIIIDWAKEVGGNVADVYKADEIPWCGLFMAVIAKRAGKELPKDPLWALNWGNFGKPTQTPMLGDVLTFIRTDSQGHKAGHVAMYVGEDFSTFHILGGNQSDKVCIVRKLKTSLYQARRPEYNIQPSNVRRVVVSPNGDFSTKEN